MAYTEEEFTKLLDVLVDDLLDANHHYRLYHNLRQSLKEYEHEINTYSGFWSLVFDALREVCLVHLCRAYDNRQRKDGTFDTLSLKNLLLIIQGNTEIFDISKFKERLKENSYVDSLAQEDRKLNDEQIKMDLQAVSKDTNPLVDKLYKLRNKKIAHTDINEILKGKDEPNPLTWSEIEDLINTGLRIFNEYLKRFNASTYSAMLIGENHYKEVLKLLRIGRKPIEFALDTEYAHDENRGVLNPTDTIIKTTNFVNDVLYHFYGYKLQQLNQATQKHLADKEENPQRATFHKALLASGLVKQLKQPPYSQQTERQFIQVQGKPVSETIIEERR